jgi:predicted transcriptional regulator with HTH domain
MDPIPPASYRSTVRCPARERLLLAVSSLTEAYTGQLARMLGLTPKRVKWIMHGHPPQYSVDLSPMGLGWVEEARDDRGGRIYRITPKAAGRRGRSWRTRHARRCDGRRAGEGSGEPAPDPVRLGQVQVHLTPPRARARTRAAGRLTPAASSAR